MKRILVDYKKLNHEVAALLIESYPDGYGDDDIISFKNARGEHIRAVELRTDDTLYMVKISQSLSSFISSFDDAIEKELETGTAEIEDKDELELDEDFDEDLELDLEEEYEDDMDME